MNQSQKLADRLQAVFLNGKLVAGTNYHKALEGVSLSYAQRQLGPINTIEQLSKHAHYYVAGVRDALDSGKLDIKDQFSFDFKPSKSDAEWDGFKSKFWTDVESLVNKVKSLNDEELEKHFIKEAYGSISDNILMMVDHSYYHLGQIVLIKKMI